MTYSEKLKDPRWQKRRLQLLEAANFTCRHCKSTKETLHVHHGVYRKGVEPWDYEDAVMHVLCEGCHEQSETGRRLVNEQFARINPTFLIHFSQWMAQIQDPDLLGTIILQLSFTLENELIAKPDCTERGIAGWLHQLCLDQLLRETYEAGHDAGEKRERLHRAQNNLA